MIGAESCMWISIVVMVATLAVAYFLLPFAWRKLGEARLAHACRTQRAIALTYDDGPGAELTPKLLSMMETHRIKGCFFMLGRNVTGKAEMARHVNTEGHMVGSHSYDHLNAWKALPGSVATDVMAGFHALEKAGVKTQFFRPPYGKMNLIGLVQTLAMGFRFGWWTIDSRDVWDRRSIEVVIAELARQRGGVVLMHDYDQYTGREGEIGHVEHVLALTEAIIHFARREGYVIKTLTEIYSDMGGSSNPAEAEHV